MDPLVLAGFGLSCRYRLLELEDSEFASGLGLGEGGGEGLAAEGGAGSGWGVLGGGEEERGRVRVRVRVSEMGARGLVVRDVVEERGRRRVRVRFRWRCWWRIGSPPAIHGFWGGWVTGWVGLGGSFGERENEKGGGRWFEL